jgi:multiple sugar transport system substrate-binding protein
LHSLTPAGAGGESTSRDFCFRLSPARVVQNLSGIPPGPGRPQPPDASPLQVPEGPYETANAANAANQPMLRFLELMERLHAATERDLDLRAGGREMPAIIHLVQRHLSGQLVTPASLAAASRLSYGTANRMIEAMLASGLILQRSRTSSGKSVSLHPSEQLLARWHRFAQHAHAILKFDAAASAGPQASSGGYGPGERARSIPPPPVLGTRLLLGKSLRVLMHADPTFMAMTALKRQLEMMLGVPITSRALSIDRLHTAIVENSRLPVSQYDIVACDFPWFGEMASHGRFLALDGMMRDSQVDLDDFYPDALATSRFGDVQFGIPVLATAELLVYRRDLLLAAGVTPPRTVDATVAAARRLHDPSKNVAGIAWNGGRGTPVGHSFIMVLGAFGRSIFDLRQTRSGFDAEHVRGEQMRPTFLSAEAAATVAYLRELLQYSPPDVLRMAWHGRALAYANGRAAMAYSHSLLAPLYELDSHSAAYRKSGYLPHPTGPMGRPVVPMGGYALAIPGNIAPARVSHVWTALRALTSASASKLYLINGSLASPRVSVSQDPEVQALSPLVATIDEMARQGLVRMWPRPPVPGVTEVIAIAGEEIHDALSGAKTVQAALQAAQNRADAVMRARGYY